MNKPKPKELNKALELIAEARTIIEEMQGEDHQNLDNEPEDLQKNELREKLEENAVRLEKIMGCLEKQDMSEKYFLNVNEVSAYMGVSVPMAYKIIRKLNDELKAQGFITVAGKVNRRFFEQRVNGFLTE